VLDVAAVGGNMVKQNVTLDAVTPAFILFIGAFSYLFATETKATSREDI